MFGLILCKQLLVATIFILSELTDYSCIYQDDRHDWGIEASRMKDTYRNAAFCIAATHAADSTVGLFHDRDDRGVRPVDVHIDWPNPRAMNGASMQQSDMLPVGLYSIVCEHLDEHRLVDDAPLNQRAWYVGLPFFSNILQYLGPCHVNRNGVSSMGKPL